MTASPHFFDASSSRPGGAPVDPAADPWGVRRAENLLTSLEGILSARVVTTPLGEVSEIHILAQGGQNAKQVVRNVESALLAHLGLKVDHRKISVAATADVKPLQALDLGAVRDRAAQRVVLFEDLSMATVPRPRRVTGDGDAGARWAERDGDRRGARHAAEPDGDGGAGGGDGDGPAVRRAGAGAGGGAARWRCSTGALWWWACWRASARDSRLLMGTAEVRESVEHAAVYAVLDATNRWAVAHKPR